MVFDNWQALPMGVLIAAVASTVGIGGGILWMPFLIIILKLRPDTAVVTSLLIQTAGMGSGTVAFWFKRQIDVRLMLFLLAVTIPGIIVGVLLTKLLAPVHLELTLGILTLSIALIFVSSSGRYGEESKARSNLKTARRYSFAFSTMAIASGMLSVSIGEWLVPLMRSKLSLTMRVAVATSIATIFGICILGASLHLCMGGRADMAALCWATPGVLIGGQIGPRIAERTNDRILKEIFIFLLTLIGIHLIYNSY
jgi:uncharacterized membrane protein YfcA